MKPSSETSSRNVIIYRSTFSNSFGNPKLNMFNIVFKCLGALCLYINPESKETYMVTFFECTFTRNINMQALTSITNGRLCIYSVIFDHNSHYDNIVDL